MPTNPVTYRVSPEVDAELRRLAKLHGGVDRALRVLFEWNDPNIPTASATEILDVMQQSVDEMVARCPECGRRKPGHSMTCKTGNQKAREHQEYRTRRGPRPKGDKTR